MILWSASSLLHHLCFDSTLRDSHSFVSEDKQNHSLEMLSILFRRNRKRDNLLLPSFHLLSRTSINLSYETYGMKLLSFLLFWLFRATNSCPFHFVVQDAAAGSPFETCLLCRGGQLLHDFCCRKKYLHAWLAVVDVTVDEKKYMRLSVDFRCEKIKIVAKDWFSFKI